MPSGRSPSLTRTCFVSPPRETSTAATSPGLKAAIAVARGGPDKVKDFRDPFGDGPFEYKALPQGFELRSKLQFRGEPVVLQVGQPPKKG